MTMANKARAPLDFVDPEAAEVARTGILNIGTEEVHFPSPSRLRCRSLHLPSRREAYSQITSSFSRLRMA